MRRWVVAAVAAAWLVLPGTVGAAPPHARAQALGTAPAGLGAPLSASVADPAPGAVLTAFADRTGDDLDGRAPDLTGLRVWSDAAGHLTFRGEIAGATSLRPSDLYALFLDTDRNAATGHPWASGADVLIAIDGRTRTVGLARWTGIRWDFGVPQASLRAAWAGGPAIAVDRAELGGTAAFRFWHGASSTDKTGATHTDVAPETGLWAHDLALAGAAVGPGLIPDLTRPRLRALPSLGRRGRVAELQYSVWDDSGFTRERIQVFRGSRLLHVKSTSFAPSEPGVAYWAGWRVPRRLAGRVRFCVQAWDEAGNASPRDCARLRLPR